MQHQAPVESARRLLSLPPRAHRFASYFVLFGFTLFLCVRLYRLIDRYAVNIFYYDQWMQSWAMLRHSGRERFASPFELAGILPGVPEISGFFAQMGTWYLGVGAIFTEVVYGLSRWNTRTEGFAIYGLVVIAMLIAFRLKASLFGPLSLADASIPAIFM